MVEGIISGRNDNEIYIGNRMDFVKTRFYLRHENYCVVLLMMMMRTLFKTFMDYEQ